MERRQTGRIRHEKGVQSLLIGPGSDRIGEAAGGMLFGGLRKTSLIDYPGKVSCVLFSLGCNFRCPYCHNPGLARGDGTPPFFFGEEELLRFLQDRRGFLEGVVLSGGEPTLQKGLLPLCRKIKQAGFPVKLDTNGSNPSMLRKLLAQGSLDYVAMDLKTDPRRYREFIARDVEEEHLLTSIRVILESGVAHEFRTTCVRPIVDEGAVEAIARLIGGADLYALQRFHRTEILHPEFFAATDPAYSEGDLFRLKQIASPWVKRCILR